MAAALPVYPPADSIIFRYNLNENKTFASRNCNIYCFMIFLMMLNLKRKVVECSVTAQWKSAVIDYSGIVKLGRSATSRG